MNTYHELSQEDILEISGGRFAYDAGFFIRGMIIYMVNGGGILGSTEALSDYALNYHAEY